jgi:O-acetylhomoserine (thiol)-lyase
LEVVNWLVDQPNVTSVSHPSLPNHRDHQLYQRYYPNGAGSIFSFEISGTLEQARCFTEALQLFSHLANVADAKSLVSHPASTTHSQMQPEELKASGISPTTIRLSIGTENVKDIIADLKQALG